MGPAIKCKVVVPESPQDSIAALLNQSLPNYDPPKVSSKSTGVIQAFAVNTHQGAIRNYNEDWVAIILNIACPISKSHLYKSDKKPNLPEWPKINYFAIYDGHGGSGCADFLWSNLHNNIINQKCFPEDPIKAIKSGCAKTEKDFMQINTYPGVKEYDKSGSCCLISLVINDKLYVANVGDSRCVLKEKHEIVELSTDHKPSEEDEW